MSNAKTAPAAPSQATTAQAAPQEPTLKTGLTRTAIIGILAFVVLFSGGAYWAWATQIAGAVIAPGQVEVIGKPKSIQHLDGGIVEEILVGDGQFVNHGEVLVRLDDTMLKANLEIYKTRLSEALATRDRLIAEQRDAPRIGFDEPDPVLVDVDKVLHRQGQQEIFTARRELERGRKEQLTEKIRQFENQSRGVDGLIEAKNRQLALIDQEITAMTTLSEKGLARASQLMGLQRSQADLLGQIAEHTSELARIQNSIRDTELEMLQGERQIKEQVVTELREVTTSIQELRQQIATTRKQLDRVHVRAPNSGRIHEMQVTTIGGVVRPGGTLLQIVPLDEGVGFRSRINPTAVDQVYNGQTATLRFSAFNQRTTPELTATVTDVSPTSVLDEVTGQEFFWVTLTVSDAELARLGDLELVPGMPVEAFIKTTDRTVLSYLVKPLTDQINQAFREE